MSSDGGPISFATLPVEWKQGDTHRPKKEKVFLSGKTDNGLRKIFMQVIAWKFDLSLDKPSISVLSQEGNWIRLLKPRIPYEDTIKTILITLHFLHFVKRKPQRPIQDLWDCLNRSFSTFERRPSEDDLVVHLPLINEAVMRDEALANSKILITFLKEPVKRKPLNEVVNPSFIVVDENDDHEGGFDETDYNGDAECEKDDCFDSVCAFCNNGGEMTVCDGICMRSFHTTVKDGEDSQCESLGFTDKDLEAIKDVSFICKNCQHKQHQCFACGKLGSSDESFGPELQVFCCANGACGFFYHPSCVAKLLHPGNKKEAEEHQQKIAAGEQFACPIHRCHACKELEVRSTSELQFAVSRCCPRAYHRKCLPREIALEDDAKQGFVQRAWEDLLPKRVLNYCLDHEIDTSISTHARDHIKFPGPQREKTICGRLSVDPIVRNYRVCPPDDMWGTTVAMAIWPEHISAVSDGRGVTERVKQNNYDEEYAHAVTSCEKKLFKLGTEYIVGVAGSIYYSNLAYEKLVAKMGDPEMRGKGMGHIIAAVDVECLQAYIEDEPYTVPTAFPASLCVVGHGEVHFLGIKKDPFSTIINGTEVNFIFMGSGGPEAEDHLEKQLAKRNGLHTIDAISELLIESVSATLLRDCCTGGCLHRVEYPKGTMLSMDYDVRPYILKEIGNRFEFMEPYFDRACLILSHFDVRDIDHEFNFQKYLKLRLHLGIVEVLLLGANDPMRIGVRLVRFGSSELLEAAVKKLCEEKVRFNRHDVVYFPASKSMFGGLADYFLSTVENIEEDLI